jgi:hypothetical protein
MKLRQRLAQSTPRGFVRTTCGERVFDFAGGKLLAGGFEYAPPRLLYSATEWSFIFSLVQAASLRTRELTTRAADDGT